MVDLREEVSQLKEKLKKAEEFSGDNFKKVAGVMKNDGDDSSYCPNCFNQKKIIILSPMPSYAVADMAASYMCITCKGHLGDVPPRGDNSPMHFNPPPFRC